MEPTAPVPPAVPPQIPVAPPVPPIVQPPNKSRKKIITGVIVLVLIIILSVAGFFVFGKSATVPSLTPLPTPTVIINTPTPKVSTNTLNETVILKKGIETPVPNTDIVLLYTKTTEVSENCADCIATTAINIKHGTNLKELDYSCGGIAGKCDTKVSQFGYTVELLQVVDSETVKVLVTNK